MSPFDRSLIAPQKGPHFEIFAHGQMREYASAFRAMRDAQRVRIWRGVAPLILRPSKVIVPLASGSIPLIAFSVVVLPAPFAPMRVTSLTHLDLDRDVAQRGDRASAGL